jgi:hypothetical protein
MNMPWSPDLTLLRNILASLYLSRSEILAFIDDVGLNPAVISFEPTSRGTWHYVLRNAQANDKIQTVMQRALEDFPENPILRRLLERRPVMGDERPEWNWLGSGVNAPTLEKLMGNKSSLLPATFLSRGWKVSKSVGKITRSDGTMGTGFLISEDVILTNHHVLPDINSAQGTIINFDYVEEPEPFDAGISLSPQDGFATDESADWTAVKITRRQKERSFIAVGEYEARAHEPVNIIQHPAGGFKQAGLYNNLVTFVDNNVVQYLTDTLPGSSGSPVFNNAWQIVAIHNSGGWLREPDTQMLLYRNQGIPFRRVASGLHNLSFLKGSDQS